MTADPGPANTSPEWLKVKDQTASMPTHLAATTIYVWAREVMISIVPNVKSDATGIPCRVSARTIYPHHRYGRI